MLSLTIFDNGDVIRFRTTWKQKAIRISVWSTMTGARTRVALAALLFPACHKLYRSLRPKVKIT